ncbi:hypothetical protein P5673_033211 [Acropora cervicornis]|uniref:Uncharacterized protein n=1 Tax=Acropora cervicornis TaxID=6130 RepID=A0AAD9PQ74_ACRCE|nr:hypothetical protein P5673_033211 [Acropora cervicornis]
MLPNGILATTAVSEKAVLRLADDEKVVAMQLQDNLFSGTQVSAFLKCFSCGHGLTTTALTCSSLRYDKGGEARALLGAKQRQKFHDNQHTKPLEEISPGETVRVKLPGKERWTKETCAEALDHRSYFVKVGDTQYRRNRRHLLKTGEPSTPEQGEDINPTPPASEENNPESCVPGEHQCGTRTTTSGPIQQSRTLSTEHT